MSGQIFTLKSRQRACESEYLICFMLGFEGETMKYLIHNMVYNRGKTQTLLSFEIIDGCYDMKRYLILCGMSR